MGTIKVPWPLQNLDGPESQYTLKCAASPPRESGFAVNTCDMALRLTMLEASDGWWDRSGSSAPVDAVVWHCVCICECSWWPSTTDTTQPAALHCATTHIKKCHASIILTTTTTTTTATTTMMMTNNDDYDIDNNNRFVIYKSKSTL